MKQRCYNPKNPHYSRYGARGIVVCERWLHSFANFYADMGPKPDGKTLDRKDNDGNYEKDNCQWSTPKEQQNNRSSTNVWSPEQLARLVPCSICGDLTTSKYGVCSNNPECHAAYNLASWRAHRDAATPSRLSLASCLQTRSLQGSNLRIQGSNG
jgi:hypothetical protein